MRFRNALAALAGLALALPATAQADGSPFDVLRKGLRGLGGRRGSPRSSLLDRASSRDPIVPTRSAPSFGTPDRSPFGSFLSSRRNGGSDLFRGQSVPGGGRRSAPVADALPNDRPARARGGMRIADDAPFQNGRFVGGQRSAPPPARVPAGGAGAPAGNPRTRTKDATAPGFTTTGGAGADNVRDRKSSPVGKDGFVRGMPIGPAVGEGRSPFQGRDPMPDRSHKGPRIQPAGGGSGVGAPGAGPGAGGGLAASGFRSTSTQRVGAPGAGTTWSGSGWNYNQGWRNGYRVGYRDGSFQRCCYHDWYDHNHWYLSFQFGIGVGPYLGVSYYYPFHSWTLGLDFAFFYPEPVTYCYVPYGFYSVYDPVYVTRYHVVRETVPAYVYETTTTYTVEEIEKKEADGAKGPAGDVPAEGEAKTAEPVPAATSPATEKFLREASERFKKKDYYEAAVKFRLAALSSPDQAAPLFALGQSLIALGHDDYAAKVLRKAVNLNPKLLEETGDVAGVYESQAEYDRVMGELEARAAKSPVDGDARFLLGFERYFAGDVRCREDFRLLQEARPEDEAVTRLREAVEKRFKAADELPPLPPAPAPAK
jgi:hypothetical protein